MENRIIVFRLLPEVGHHNATYHFSKTLIDNGYRVFYASVPRMRAQIEANGFEFYEVPSEEDPAEAVKVVFQSWFKTQILKLKNIATCRKQLKWARFMLLNHNTLVSLKKDLNPDLIIIDRCYGQMALNAVALKIPVWQAETTVSTSKVKGIPPYSSRYVPAFNFWSNLICELIWARIFIWRKLEALLYGDFNAIIESLARKINYPVDKINFKRKDNPGFNTMKELIFSPQEFDFPHRPLDNQYYVGPSMFHRHDNTAQDFVNPFKDSAKPLIYCALGTLSYRYSGVHIFFKRLIDAFKIRQQYNLIVCIHNDALRSEMEAYKLPNVSFFKRVPQLMLLEEVDVMINHGGMNSITECILAEVPMLVYPGTSDLDQVGNSSRVVFHGLGLRGKLAHEKTISMVAKIDRLLQDVSFKKNVQTMKVQIHTNKNYEKGLNAVQSVIVNREIDYV